MLSLEPERLDCRISTTEMEVRYTEQNGVSINVDVTPLEESGEMKMKYHQMQLNFSNVAELRCITLNFDEANYNGYELIGSNPDTGYTRYTLRSGLYKNGGNTTHVIGCS
ncbi:hypothetical protein [Paenibacillus tundrae]|uniref:hypothetical protein n=1 Tax=Paenibacillus tundrae TaxID=528187 RepID=UPI0030D48C5F